MRTIVVPPINPLSIALKSILVLVHPIPYALSLVVQLPAINYPKCVFLDLQCHKSPHVLYFFPVLQCNDGQTEI